MEVGHAGPKQIRDDAVGEEGGCTALLKMGSGTWEAPAFPDYGDLCDFGGPVPTYGKCREFEIPSTYSNHYQRCKYWVVAAQLLPADQPHTTEQTTAPHAIVMPKEERKKEISANPN